MAQIQLAPGFNQVSVGALSNVLPLVQGILSKQANMPIEDLQRQLAMATIPQEIASAPESSALKLQLLRSQVQGALSDAAMKQQNASMLSGLFKGDMASPDKLIQFGLMTNHPGAVTEGERMKKQAEDAATLAQMRSQPIQPMPSTEAQVPAGDQAAYQAVKQATKQGQPMTAEAPSAGQTGMFAPLYGSTNAAIAQAAKASQANLDNPNITLPASTYVSRFNQLMQAESQHLQQEAMRNGNQQPPVSVIDPYTGKQMFVSRDEAITRRMQPATAIEGLTPKDIQKREASYPKATLANQEIQQSTNSLITKLEKLKSHEGLSGMTGLVFGRTPNLTGEARDAQTLFDNIMSKGQIGVMMALKNASATGSTGFGQLSEKEGEVLRKSQAAIDKNQNTSDFKNGIQDWIDDLKKTQKITADAYDLTYEYRHNRRASDKSPSAGASDKSPSASSGNDPLGLR